MEEIIGFILEKEKEAEEIVAQAREEAQAIQRTAETEAREIEEAARQKAQESYQQQIADAEEASGTRMKEALAEMENYGTHLLDERKDDIETLVGEITGHLLSSDLQRMQ